MSNGIEDHKGDDIARKSISKIEIAALIIASVHLIIAVIPLIQPYFGKIPILPKKTAYIFLLISEVLFGVLILNQAFVKNRKPSSYGSILMLIFLVFFTFTVNILITTPKYDIQFEVTNVINRLEIQSNGNGKIIRTQTIKPEQPVTTIYETGLESTGDKIDTSQFHYTIREVDPRTQNLMGSYSCVPGPWDKLSKQLPTYITPKLDKGKIYQRVLTWDARNSYTDQLSDAFEMSIIYPTTRAILDVELLDSGRSFDTTHVEFRQTKSDGIAVWDEMPIGQRTILLNHLGWVIDNPIPGDNYIIEWKYSKPL
jgi:hypothetical protein